MRKLLVLALVLVTVSFGVPAGAFAQAPAQLATISGQATDAGGRALISQRVELVRGLMAGLQLRPQMPLAFQTRQGELDVLAGAQLVRGEVDAFLAECCHIWDHAPWILLVEEAGGRFTDRTGGHAGDQGGGLYSNANLHSQLLAALQYPARP